MEHLVSIYNYNYESWNKKFQNKEIKLFKFVLDPKWRYRVFNELMLKIDYKHIENTLSKSLNRNILPYPDLLFSAFNYTDYDNLKVIFIGQDPYFGTYTVDGKCIPEAMGLSFSVPMGIPIPSSLKNVFKNALRHGHINKIPEHGNLQFWAYQGCLMLNTALTVIEYERGIHVGMWSEFTDFIIKKISDNKKNLVFVLWGAFAHKKINLIDTSKHHVIVSSHPSGLSYNKKMGNFPSFESIDHFGIINKYLIKHHKTPIIWQT